jgi:three-Cys-motif partner protein
MPRPWSYWTRNKLEILAGYLPALNKAAQRSPHRIYLDLMAGEPENVDRDTGERFDGSPLIAMKADPPFTRLRFCELGQVATKLDAALRAQFQGDDRYRVIHGDCNATIDQTLAELAPFRRGLAFAFIDQQAAEVDWETIKKVAAYRQNRENRKTEIWILMSPAMIVRGVRGTNAAKFIEKVSRMYGDEDWKRIQAARWRDDISPSDYRAEMVNLMRLRLQYDLRYQYTQRIPMRMPNAVEVYDMVFATDHWAGDNIMRYLYNRAAQREEGMMRQAKSARREKELDERGEVGLFSVSDLPIDESRAGEILWQETPTWDPRGHDWWHEEPDF